MIRLLLFEDNELLRNSLEHLFSDTQGIVLCGAYGNCDRAVRNVLYHQPDVVLMDIGLPGEMNGIVCTRALKEKRPETSVLIHTVFEDSQKIFDSLAAGADGYLLKTTSPEALIEAVKNISVGGTPITPGVARKVLEYFRQNDAANRVSEISLSDRERQVLQMLCKGFTYKRISFECNVSIDTTRTHIRNIYTKLHVNCGTEAVAKALRLRLFND